jgi:CRISPR-associated endonuclease/helicase Cas3
MPAYYAHSSPKGNPPPDGWQPLRDHLQGVADLAEKRAVGTGVSDLPNAAKAAGWLHDLGKYRHPFQEFIRGRTPAGSKQHKEAGAAWAARCQNLPLTFAILGHHGGMPDRDEAMTAVRGPDGIGVVRQVEAHANSECPELTGLGVPKRGEASAETDLFARLLLSCLVDADWSDTGEHERVVKGWPAYPVPPELEPGGRLKSLLAFIARRAESTRARNPVLATTRQQILDACLSKAARPPGLFSLTVPTGGGKTLSGLAFALKHAEQHGQRRVVYVAPYISILDQNADVIRQGLGVTDGDLTVFEHQSLAEPQGPKLADEQQTSAAARRAENWDSPVVVTTNVQFFESLFSNKPGRCRKLHNVARSVIVLDECQTLPPDLVRPTCQMLKHLTTALGCTVVLCTATQPAFDHCTLGDHRLDAEEIIPKEVDLFAALKRVEVKWPGHRDERLAWGEVAARMAASGSALCVVNTKSAALDLFAELKNLSHHVYHLSTSMCPAHRLAVLDVVKRRLDAKKLVSVVSTQLIEAGVDIDFPCVFREMAPLESIIQAAGRCNREGLIPNAGGRVVVFRSEEGETRIPPGWYRRGRDVLETEFLAAGVNPSVEVPADILNYFSRLYWRGDLDPKNVVGMRSGMRFTGVADAYKLIAEDTVPVVVATWQDEVDPDSGVNWQERWRGMKKMENPQADVRGIQERLDELIRRPSRATFRALAPFQVNVFRSELPRLPKGMVLPVSEDADLFIWHGIYDPQIGRTSEFQNLIDAI